MPPHNSFQQLLLTVRKSVDESLSEVWRQEIEDRKGDGRAVSIPLVAASELCSRGGKRLRAALVAAAYCACRSSTATLSVDIEPIVPVCTAVELLQSYFLIHDDWMDGDETRRGGPAVHARLGQSWESEHLAAAGGVLAGDFTLALATRVLAKAEAAQACLPAVLEQFAQMHLDAVAGQLLDVLDAEPDIERVYELKTGSYTVVGPLQLGGLLAGSSGDWFEGLQPFGLALGIAFQLQDDLIGMFAEQSVTGKPRGSDLKSGKQTLLCQMALQMASPEGRAQLSGVLGNQQASPADVEKAIVEVKRCGAEHIVRERIDSLVRKAKSIVAESEQLTDTGRTLLLEIAAALTDRNS